MRPREPRSTRRGIRAWRALAFMLPAIAPLAAVATTPGDGLRARIAAASPGATIQVPAGRYDGPFVIDKPIHLLGVPGAVLDGNHVGNVVSVRAADVEIAGFVIRGSGRDLQADNAAIHVTGARALIHDNRITDMLHGVYVRQADGCRIIANVIVGPGAADEKIADPLIAGLKVGDAATGEMCGAPLALDRRGNGIHLWKSSGHVIEGNIVRGTRDGVYFSFTNHTQVRANTITRVRYGLHYMYSDDNTFEGNVFSENAAGAALMYSRHLVLRRNRFVGNDSQRAYGLLLQSIDDTRVEDNEIAGNTLGIYLENGNGNTVRDNRIASNYIGLRLSDSTAATCFTGNAFVGNIHPIEGGSEAATNLWAVAGRGNYWDGALVLDLDHDGVADLPHYEPDLFGPLRRTFPAIGLLSASPGERLLRWIASQVGLPGVAGITDPKPRSHP